MWWDALHSRQNSHDCGWYIVILFIFDLSQIHEKEKKLMFYCHAHFLSISPFLSQLICYHPLEPEPFKASYNNNCRCSDSGSDFVGYVARLWLSARYSANMLWFLDRVINASVARTYPEAGNGTIRVKYGCKIYIFHILSDSANISMVVNSRAGRGCGPTPGALIVPI